MTSGFIQKRNFFCQPLLRSDIESDAQPRVYHGPFYTTLTNFVPI